MTKTLKNASSARRSEFVVFVLEQLALLGRTRARAMFGGYGIYRDDLMFAIIDDDRLYFKTDPATQEIYRARNLPAFSYTSRGQRRSLNFHEAPPEVFEEPEAMHRWAHQAVRVAVNARRRRGVSRRAKQAFAPK